MFKAIALKIKSCIHFGSFFTNEPFIVTRRT